MYYAFLMEILLLEYDFSMLYTVFYFLTVIATNYFCIIEKERVYVTRKKISIT